MIACNLITQTIAELKIAFSKCMKIKNSDLSKLVDLSVALATCRTYPYKVYVATVNKSNALSPLIVTNVLENSLGPITFELDQGYLLKFKSNNLFTNSKTVVFLSFGFDNENYSNTNLESKGYISDTSSSLIIGAIDNVTNLPNPNYLLNLTVEIRVYS